MKILHKIAFILVIIGGLNWLLVALGIGYLGMGVVEYLPVVVAKIVYILVGLSAIILVATHKKSCGDCKSCTCGHCDSCKADAPKM